MEIKVIDLLNKIANGEKPPQKIKHLKQIYMLYENYEDTGLIKYENNEDFYVLDLINSLNDTVEIIEEPEIDIQGMSWEEIGERLGKMYLELGKGFEKAIKQLDKQIKEK